MSENTIFEINDSCESACQCCEKTHYCELIVLTGGPGAGKTAVLESIRKLLCSHIALIPEAASIIFSGGFWRLNSLTAQLSVQRAIYHVQQEMELLVKNEKQWGIGICDRGTLDGLAYWPENEGSFWQSFNTSIEKEYLKYKAIIHLRTPDLVHGYNHENPNRTETAEEAKRIDNRIKELWHNHPRYFEVASEASFLKKLENSASIIKGQVPKCCAKHFE